MKPHMRDDDIDSIVDDLIRHPERVKEVKAALRARIIGEGAESASKAASPSKPAERVIRPDAAAVSQEVEDLWDNVPV